MEAPSIFTRKRRNFFINPKFQTKFIVFMLAVGVLVSLIFLAATYYFFWKFHLLGISLNLGPGHVFFQFLRQQEIFMLKILAIALVMIFGSVICMGVLFSHRIAGPLYKLHKHFKESGHNNQFSEVHFRKKDFFQELAVAYNEHISHRVTNSTEKTN